MLSTLFCGVVYIVMFDNLLAICRLLGKHLIVEV